MIYLSLIPILMLGEVQSIKNGRWANDDEFPFVVSIQNLMYHLCSGTIINGRHILTVAHVVSPYSPSSLEVMPEVSMRKWPFRSSTVKNIFSHPHYHESTLISSGRSDSTWENDIAILRLVEYLSENVLMNIAALSTAPFTSYQCFECTIISWSYLDETDLRLVALMWDIVIMVDNNRCEEWGIRVPANEHCFIDVMETAFISTEDLGSPIICGGSIVGLIVKEAQQGQAMSPAAFLSTLNYAGFISEVANAGQVNALKGEFPYMVSVYHSNKHSCGGIIVNQNQIIVAGRCIRGARRVYPIKVFYIAAGNNIISQFDNTLAWFSIEHMNLHAFYKRHDEDENWSTDHDIGLITVTTAFSWTPTLQKFSLAEEEDLSNGQLCQVLRWTKEYDYQRKEFRRLIKTTAILVSTELPLRTNQFAARELYTEEAGDMTDIGNPIVCGGHPLGILIQTHPATTESQGPTLVFLRIRPYRDMGFFEMS